MTDVNNLNNADETANVNEYGEGVSIYETLTKSYHQTNKPDEELVQSGKRATFREALEDTLWAMGGTHFLKRIASENPLEFLKIAARLLPLEFDKDAAPSARFSMVIKVDEAQEEKTIDDKTSLQ